MGDKISHISNSTIVNRSVVEGAINTLHSRNDDEAAKILEQLTALVSDSGNKEAGELLEEFSTELAKPEPRRSILRTIWSGIQNALPTASKMLELGEGINKLIS